MMEMGLLKYFRGRLCPCWDHRDSVERRLFQLTGFIAKLWHGWTPLYWLCCSFNFNNNGCYIMDSGQISLTLAGALGSQSNWLFLKWPSLEYCIALVLPSALNICHKWAYRDTTSPLFSSAAYGQVQSTHLALHLPAVHTAVCVWVCVWIYYSTKPVASPADRSGREKKPSTHSHTPSFLQFLKYDLRDDFDQIPPYFKQDSHYASWVQ